MIWFPELEDSLATQINIIVTLMLKDNNLKHGFQIEIHPKFSSFLAKTNKASKF